MSVDPVIPLAQLVDEEGIKNPQSCECGCVSVVEVCAASRLMDFCGELVSVS